MEAVTLKVGDMTIYADTMINGFNAPTIARLFAKLSCLVDQTRNKHLVGFPFTREHYQLYLQTCQVVGSDINRFSSADFHYADCGDGPSRLIDELDTVHRWMNDTLFLHCVVQ